MNFTQQDATQVPTCALTSLKIFRIMLVIGIDRNLTKSTGKEMNKSLWKSNISFQEQSNHQIRAVWKSKINGWRLETLKGRDFRYDYLWKTLISQLFLVQIRICRMWILWETGHKQKTIRSILQCVLLCIQPATCLQWRLQCVFHSPNLVTISLNQFIFGCKNVYSIMHYIYLLDKFN